LDKADTKKLSEEKMDPEKNLKNINDDGEFFDLIFLHLLRPTTKVLKLFHRSRTARAIKFG
jgi:hypothetical protein